jgi:hypothetical protein
VPGAIKNAQPEECKADSRPAFKTSLRFWVFIAFDFIFELNFVAVSLDHDQTLPAKIRFSKSNLLFRSWTLSLSGNWKQKSSHI